MTQRYVLEGEWSGYRSSQQRVVHRAVTKHPKRYEHLREIVYTDGTKLWVSMRPCLPREKVQEIKGYTSLIDQAARKGVRSVSVRELD